MKLTEAKTEKIGERLNTGFGGENDLMRLS